MSLLDWVYCGASALVLLIIGCWLAPRPPWLVVVTWVLIVLMALHIGATGWHWAFLPVYGVAVLAWLVVMGLSLLLPRFRFPALTGPYQVGTETRHWVDATRNGRELMVQFWYPTSSDVHLPRARYMHDATAFAKAVHVPGWLLRYLNTIPTHAYENAPLAPEKPTYPVLLFSHGLTGVRMQNTWQCQELASHGYVVVAPDHTDYAAVTAFPDGRLQTFDPLRIGITPEMMARAGQDPAQFLAYYQAIQAAVAVEAADLRFLTDQLHLLHEVDPRARFTGRCDLAHLGAWGHSLGGATAWEFCRVDPRCRAALNLDGPPPEESGMTGIPKPIGHIRSSNPPHFASAAVQALAQDKTTDAVARSCAASPGPWYQVRLARSGHFSFSDAPLLAPRTFGRFPTLLGTGGRREVRALNAFIVAFFDRYLEGGLPPETHALDGRYLEILAMLAVPSPEVG